MKLKMLVSMSGADFTLRPGEETERFASKEAQRLIDAGFAVPATEDKPERAVKKPAPEKRG
ncbi:hypothetical protein [Neoaquamicrobium sediminum]|uniref:hypothetical protein n=1 Tax=Neoaquamicrobium sediminum TaxID=1849104 RepID=UPI003BAC3235